MLQVALETSDRRASVALRDGDEVVSDVLDPARAHASDCLPRLARWLAERGRDPLELDAVFVGTGPGSYTGLRIGVATALGLARGARAALRGEPSGEVLAFGALTPGEEAIHLLDARQQELYFARYRRTVDDVEVLEAPCVLALDELAARLRDGVRLIGEPQALTLAGLPADGLPDAGAPSAAALLELGRLRLERLGPHGLDAVQPLYLRPFAAKVRRR